VIERLAACTRTNTLTAWRGLP